MYLQVLSTESDIGGDRQVSSFPEVYVKAVKAVVLQKLLDVLEVSEDLSSVQTFRHTSFTILLLNLVIKMLFRMERKIPANW